MKILLMPRRHAEGGSIWSQSERLDARGTCTPRTWYSSINGETNNFDIDFDFDVKIIPQSESVLYQVAEVTLLRVQLSLSRTVRDCRKLDIFDDNSMWSIAIKLLRVETCPKFEIFFVESVSFVEGCLYVSRCHELKLLLHQNTTLL